MNGIKMYESCYEDIYDYIFFHVRNSDIAEELTHETYLEAFERGINKNLITKEKLISKLLAIAQNICQRYSDKLTKRQLSTEFTNKNYEHFLQDRKLEEEEYFEIINKSLYSLKLEYQEVIHLHIFKNLSYKECAETLGITIEAYTSRLKRAKQALIHRLTKEFYPNYKKGQLAEDEIKVLMRWFDLLDKPKNLPEEISRISANFFNGMHSYYKTFRLDTYPEGLDDYLLSRVPLDSHYICADFGCGKGHLSINLSPKVNKVYAIDNSSEMINSISRLAQNKNFNNIHPAFGNVINLNITEMVDVGFCHMLLHHVFDPERAICEMAKTLKPGGHFIIGDLYRTKDNWLYKEMHDFWSGFEIEQLQEWLMKANLKIISLEKSNEYVFRFHDIKSPHKRIEVPLIFAHCVKP